MGRVVPDTKYAGMWRPVLASGQLGDIANLSWAKSHVLDAAARELEWEARQQAANAPLKSQERRGDFQSPASPMRSREVVATPHQRGQHHDQHRERRHKRRPGRHDDRRRERAPAPPL
jgi:hypothetical protein